MAGTTESKQITITLTGRAPARISEGEWPVIAKAHWDRYDGEVEQESNRDADVQIEVRRHEGALSTGRVIVSGSYRYYTRFRGEDNVSADAGSLVEAGGDVIAAIREVVEHPLGLPVAARALAAGLDDAHRRGDRGAAPRRCLTPDAAGSRCRARALRPA